MEVIVHEFYVYEIADPDIHAASQIYEWENTSEGQWVFKNSVSTPSWHRCHHGNSLGWKYIIKAELEDSALTAWTLKKSDNNKKAAFREF